MGVYQPNGFNYVSKRNTSLGISVLKLHYTVVYRVDCKWHYLRLNPKNVTTEWKSLLKKIFSFATTKFIMPKKFFLCN